MTTRLVVDGANVVGARPDGWWRDRAGAARRLHEALLVADLPHDEIVLVLEGGAKGGVRAGGTRTCAPCTRRGPGTTRSSPSPAPVSRRATGSPS